MLDNKHEIDPDRLKYFMSLKGFDIAGLARSAGISADTVKDVLHGFRKKDGSTTRVNDGTCRGIARVLDTTIDQLTKGSPLASTSSMTLPTALQGSLCDFTAFIDDRTHGFVGRDVYFEALDSFISTNESGYFMLRGEPGIGKSAFISKVVKLRKCIHHFNIGLQGINRLDQFLGNVCSQLIGRFRLPYVCLPEDIREDGAFLSKVLNEAANTRSREPKIVIAIDALDEVNQPDIGPLANILHLPHVLPNGVFVVASCRMQHDLQLSVAKQRTLDLEANSDGNLEDLREFIESRIRDSNIQSWIQSHSVSALDFESLLVEKSEGNFLYATYVLTAIGSGDFTDVTLKELPAGIRAYYQMHWRKMRDRRPHDFDSVTRGIVCTLAAADESLSVSTIGEICECPNYVVQDICRSWLEFLDVGTDSTGEQTYRLYHKTFKEFLEEEVDVGLRDHKRKVTDWILKRYRLRKAK